MRQAIQCFEKVTRAQLNPSKSKAMDLRGWTVPATELGFAFHVIDLWANYTTNHAI